MAKLQDIRFKKGDLSQAGKVKLNQQMLMLLRAVDENKALVEIARETKMRATEFKKCLAQLYRLGLVEKVTIEIEMLKEEYLDEIRDSLVNLLGPLGEVLIQDAAKNLGITPPNIPKPSLANFVEALVAEIPGEKQKMTFQEAMEHKIPEMMK